MNSCKNWDSACVWVQESTVLVFNRRREEKIKERKGKKQKNKNFVLIVVYKEVGRIRMK